MLTVWRNSSEGPLAISSESGKPRPDQPFRGLPWPANRIGYILPHPDELGTLTGEDEGQPAHETNRSPARSEIGRPLRQISSAVEALRKVTWTGDPP